MMIPLFDHIERLHLRTKLLIGSLSGLVAALVIGLYGLNGLRVMEHQVERMYDQELLTLAHIKEANLNLLYVSRNLRHMLIAPDEATRAAARANIARARERLLSELEQGRARLTDPKAIERHQAFERDLNIFLETAEQAMALVEREPYGASPASRFITSPEFQAVVARADNGLHELATLAQRGSAESLETARGIMADTQRGALLLLIVGIVGSLVCSGLIGASIQRPGERLRSSVETLAGGTVDGRIPHTDYPNEIGAMARAIHVLQRIYRESNDQHWVKGNVAELVGLVQQSPDEQALAHQSVSHLTPLVGAAHGAFYMAHAAAGPAGADRTTLRLMGTYGLRERQRLGHEWRLGEGLVGQCAMERSPILLHAPGAQVQIAAGLLDRPAAQVMALPLLHRDRLLGVLEIATLTPLSPRARALLEAAAEVLGTHLGIMARQQALPTAQA